MMEEIRSVAVQCPQCKVKSSIRIPSGIVETMNTSTMSVQVKQGACCDAHSFIAFIDKKFKVKAYQKVDAEVIVDGDITGVLKPQPEIIEKTQDKNPGKPKELFVIEDFLDRFGTNIMYSAVRAVMIKQPLIFISDYDVFNDIERIFAWIHDLDEHAETSKMKRTEIDQEMLFEEMLIVEPTYRMILASPFTADASLDFEKNLLNAAQKIPDRGGQILFIRKELNKIQQFIKDLVPVLEEKSKFYEQDVMEMASTRYNLVLKSKDIRSVREIVELTHGSRLAKKIVDKYVDMLL